MKSKFLVSKSKFNDKICFVRRTRVEIFVYVYDNCHVSGNPALYYIILTL